MTCHIQIEASSIRSGDVSTAAEGRTRPREHPTRVEQLYTMHTLQVGKSWFGPSTGGLARVYHGLIQHLPDVGVDVRGLIINEDHDAVYHGYPVRGAASAKDPLYRRFLGLRRVFRECFDLKDFDLAASHFALYTLPVLDKLRPLPLVVHFHGPWWQESAAEGQHGVKIHLKKLIERTIYHRAVRFVVLSEAFREVLAAQYDIPEGLIRVVPGGVNVARFDVEETKRAARERLDWPMDRPIVLAVRRLVRRMGLDSLIDSIDGVRRRIPDVLLMIAGRGPLFEELTARAEASGLQNHVRMLGFISDEDLPLAYRAADVTVVPTVALEGFGLITIESLAAGTPVLVTPAGGLPEVVRDLSADLIMPDGRSSTITEYLTDVLAGTLTLPSADACRSYARERYDWRAVALQVRAVYEEAMQ